MIIGRKSAGILFCIGVLWVQGCVSGRDRTIDSEMALLRGQAKTMITDAGRDARGQSGEYRETVKPGDVFRVEVWLRDRQSQFEGFPFERKVPAGGKLFVPHVGISEIAGRTDAEIENDLMRYFTRILKDPTILVEHSYDSAYAWRDSVLRMRHVSIMGWVNRPGLYLHENGLTVRDVIAHAEGLKDFADSRRVYVVRGNVKEPEVITVNIGEVMKGRNLDRNIALEPNDAVYVPPINMWKVYDVVRKVLLPISAVRDAVWVAGSPAVAQ